MPALVLANGEGGVGVQTAVDALGRRADPVEVVEAGIRVVESDPKVRTVGLGGAPNILGEMECDASVMCGSTLRSGAVGALRGYTHPISVAREVMEHSPHVMLVGDGAARFAKEIGAEQGNLLSDEARADYENWLRQNLSPELLNHWPDVALTPLVWPSANPETAKGTTCFLVRDSLGHWAGGVSTSGWAYKYPGRLGDSPVIGAGMYVDDRYGAAACTHTGEMAIRAGISRAVVVYLKKGASAKEACLEALNDLNSLKGGHLGPLVLHVVDREGTPFVAGRSLKHEVPYWYWQEGMQAPEGRKVQRAD